MHSLRAAQGGATSWSSATVTHRAVDVCRRRPERTRTRRVCPSSARAGQTAQQHDHRHGAHARGSLHRQRGEVQAARQSDALNLKRATPARSFCFRRSTWCALSAGCTRRNSRDVSAGRAQPLAGLRGTRACVPRRQAHRHVSPGIFARDPRQKKEAWADRRLRSGAGVEKRRAGMTTTPASQFTASRVFDWITEKLFDSESFRWFHSLTNLSGSCAGGRRKFLNCGMG